MNFINQFDNNAIPTYPKENLEDNKENINYDNNESKFPGHVGEAYVNVFGYTNNSRAFGTQINIYPQNHVTANDSSFLNQNRAFQDQTQNTSHEISVSQQYISSNTAWNSNKPKLVDVIKKQHEACSKNIKVMWNLGKTQESEIYQNNNQSKSSLNTSCTSEMPLNGFGAQEGRIPIYTAYSKQIPHEYLLEIWETLKYEEKSIDQSYDGITHQKDINEKMRAILIDWLVEVHYRFNLKPETLFLTVSTIDRYLAHTQILRSKLQLLGISALFISCKYEEILCPDLRDFVYVTDKTYNKTEILEMEQEILKSLSFNLTIPSSLQFFEIIALNFNFDEYEFLYGKYLLELFLIDSKMNKYSPSLIAMSASYIVMKINNRPNYQDLYSLINLEIENNSTKNLKECAKEIYYLIQNVETVGFKAVFNKFSSSKYLKVSVYGCRRGFGINGTQ